MASGSSNAEDDWTQEVVRLITTTLLNNSRLEKESLMEDLDSTLKRIRGLCLDALDTKKWVKEEVIACLEHCTSGSSFNILQNSSLTVGRDRDSDICIEHRHVSKTHAVVFANDYCVMIRLQSLKNGILINDIKYGSETSSDIRLYNGDKIQVGHDDFVLKYILPEEVQLKVPAHELFEHDFKVSRKSDSSKHCRKPFRSVVPANRRPVPSKRYRSSPAIRHQSKNRLNTRNRNLYDEQVKYLDEMHPSTFSLPLASSSPTPNSPFNALMKNQESSHSSSDDIILEREASI